MGTIGKISIIKKERNTSITSLESSLARHGFYRFPGTGVRLEVFKEPSGRFRTGLDPDALYIEQMLSKEAQETERKRVTALKQHLEAKTGIDLSPYSDYYKRRNDINYSDAKAQSVRIMDQDTVFDLDNPHQAITYAWLRVHPQVARSYQAWLDGEYLPSTQFFVNDEDIENTMVYKRKTAINKAIGELDKMGLEKRKKIGRLLGLPVSDSSREEFVYNTIDNFLKQAEVGEGKYKGRNPLDLFTKFVSLSPEVLEVEYLVSELIKHSVLRYKRGKLFEGEIEVANSEQDLVDRLLTPKNQEDLLAYQEKLKAVRIS